jgi:6-phosphogluconolactonase
VKSIAQLIKGITVIALTTLIGGAPARAGTFVYVSNADDGDIGVYSVQADGSLKSSERAKAANLVMPMAVSPDRRFLYAAARSKPYSVFVYAIDPTTGALKTLSVSALAESFPYISLDKTGRYLFGASYGSHLITVNAVGEDGRVAPEPLQVIPVGRNAHSIRTDESNRFVFVPTLGSDEIFQFTFDAKTGHLASNTPAVFLTKPALGPRHFITSSDNKFVYVLSELTGAVTTFSLNSGTGLLTEVSSRSGLPPESKLARRAAPPSRRARRPAAAQHRQRHLGRRFASDAQRQILYMTERTSNSLATFSVDGATGNLIYLGSTPTEKQPRGFAIDPKGRFLVVAGEKSDTISAYAIDEASGALKLTGKYPAGKGANWVEIVNFD